ncbi:MAG TPA: site-2 protease family protein [Thermodesulfovibrionales bacterium]|nr:site-2 protease family protein [Thermodesulfovibrionales bacterium]
MITIKISKNCEFCVSPFFSVLELAAIFLLLQNARFVDRPELNGAQCLAASFLVLGGTLGSLFMHEYAHFSAARWLKLPVRGITISMFGAYTYFESEPATPREAFVVSIAGPTANILAGAFFYIAHFFLMRHSVIAGSALLCVALFNGVFSAYNLLPVMPLDGALILRSVFWGASSNQGWSTRVSFAIGTGIVLISIGAGVVNMFIFKPLLSATLIVLGISLWQTERQAYQQMMSARFFSMVKPGSH